MLARRLIGGTFISGSGGLTGREFQNRDPLDSRSLQHLAGSEVRMSLDSVAGHEGGRLCGVKLEFRAVTGANSRKDDKGWH